MTISRYFKHDFFTARELNRIDSEIDFDRVARSRVRRENKKQNEHHERDIAFLSLINMTLIEILIDKGVMTKDELIDKLTEIDFWDGEHDAGLSPDAVAENLGMDIIKEAPDPDKPKKPILKKKR